MGKVRLDVRWGFTLWWVKTGAINSVAFWQICGFQSTRRYNILETLSWAAVLESDRLDWLMSIFNCHHTLSPESPVHIHKLLTCAASALHLFHIIQQSHSQKLILISCFQWMPRVQTAMMTPWRSWRFSCRSLQNLSLMQMMEVGRCSCAHSHVLYSVKENPSSVYNRDSHRDQFLRSFWSYGIG